MADQIPSKAVGPAERAMAHLAAESVTRLFEEADIPPSSATLPVAPLGPLIERLQVAQSELPGLTARTVERYLQSRGIVGKSGLDLTGDQDSPLSGFLFASGRAARLFVNADEIVVRRRFSIAHELGHYVLHFRPQLSRWREAIEMGADVPPTFCDSYSITDPDDSEAASGEGASDEDASDNTIEIQEHEADAFAAELLMPQAVVRNRRATLVSDFSGATLTDRLAMEFLVSRAAMRRRLHGLSEQA